jgi:CarD family transcriptional regulator
VTLTRDRDDLVNGFLSAASPFGAKLLGHSEDDEIEFSVDGRTRRVLILRVERSANSDTTTKATVAKAPPVVPEPAAKMADASAAAQRPAVGTLVTIPGPTAGASGPIQRPTMGSTARRTEIQFPDANSTGPRLYSPGGRIRHPKYGLGVIDRIATEDVAGTPLEVIHITFDDNSMTLKVPVAKAAAQGLRRF